MAHAKAKESPASKEEPESATGESFERWVKPKGLTPRGWGILAAVILALNAPILHMLLKGPMPAGLALPYTDDFPDSTTIHEHYFTTGGGLWRSADGWLFSPGVKNNPLWLKAQLP